MNAVALRQVIENAPGMLAYWDSAERCVFANRAYEQWFGVTPEALVGTTLRQLLGPLYALNAPYIRGVLRGERQQFERDIPDPRGGPVRHSLAVYVPHLEAQRVLGFTVQVSDVTQLKLTEASLRAALREIKTLRGFIAVCAWCRRVNDGAGRWTSLEQYVVDHTDAQITHGLCDSCGATHFGGSGH